MTRNKDNKIRNGRRGFMRDAAALGGIATLFAVGGRALAGGDEPPGQPVEPAASKGYRVTEHIKSYYRSLQ